MRVLLYVRANSNTVKGGDLVQLYSTGEALKLAGVRVEFSSDKDANLSSYDIIHIFNSPRFEETKSFFENALKQNKPIAFSTIFWSKDELAVGIAKNKSVHFVYKSLGIGVAKKYRKLGKKLKNLANGENEEKVEKWLFRNSNILLPNSEGEMQEISKVYGADGNYQVVRNAIDTSLFAKEPSKNREEYVLSVGRLERRKNTIKLIDACTKLGLKLVLVGGYDTIDEYAKECLAKVKNSPNFKHIGHVGQKDLAKYYYSAKVHAMVGWYETPGLSSMEAACGGCNIVSTDRGSTKEYFGNLVEYCDPFLQSSIEDALRNANDSINELRLREKIMTEYTWQKAAQDTIKGYNRVLEDVASESKQV